MTFWFLDHWRVFFFFELFKTKQIEFHTIFYIKGLSFKLVLIISFQVLNWKNVFQQIIGNEKKKWTSGNIQNHFFKKSEISIIFQFIFSSKLSVLKPKSYFYQMSVICYEHFDIFIFSSNEQCKCDQCTLIRLSNTRCDYILFFFFVLKIEFERVSWMILSPKWQFNLMVA